MPNLSNLDAALLAQAAYGNTTNLPSGWTAGQRYTSSDGANSFTVFTNGTQAVIAFKGSDNVSNFKSDLGNSGGSAWESIAPQANSVLADLRNSGYNVETTGHSLGGGMAQTFALENNLSGYSQNALPISQQAINQDMGGQSGFNSRLAAWQNSKNTFIGTVVEGDPATLLYSTVENQTYLNTDTVKLPSPYAACEVAGLGIGALTLGVAGTAMVADCAYKAHSVNTVVDLLKNPTNTGDTSAVDSKLGEDASQIVNAAQTTAISDNNGSVSATASDGSQVSVALASSSANTDSYSVGMSGRATQTFDVVTGGGGASFSGDGATIDLFPNTNAYINGKSLSVQGAAGDNITVGGNGSSTSDIENIFADGATVSLANNSRADIHGNNDSVNAGSNDNYGVYGAGNTINSQSSSNVWIGNYGASGAADQVNANGCYVTVGDFFSASIAGANTVVADSYDNLATYSDNTHVTITGQNTTMNNYGTAVVTTVDGANDITNNHGYDDVTYNYGSGDDTYDYGSGEHNYNYGSDEYGWAASSSDTNYDANSSDTGGGYTYDPGSGGGGYGYYGYYGYYGFAGKPAANDATKGSNIGSIAQFDKAHGKPGAAAVAQKAHAEIGDAIAHAAKVVLSGAKWENNTVTWSVGDGDDFSGSMSASEVQAVKQAFAEWSAATGLYFVEVASASAADITVGMGSFDTSNTGVVGFTTFRTKAGHIQPGAVVRVEDVSEDALVARVGGMNVYGGTDATFSQTLLHEIGHAIGFGDNADPTSVESYYLSAANRTLSTNDVAQAAALYGRGSGVISGADQIIQAMSSFAPPVMAGAMAANDPIVPVHSMLYSGNQFMRR